MEPEVHEDESALEDAEAVRLSISGDTSAFDRLIEKYQRRAVSVAYRLLGNLDDAQEVSQEAFVRAFRSLQSLQEPKRFSAWLIRIVSNLSLNFRRARRPHLSLSLEDDGGGTISDRLADGGRRERSGLEIAESEELREILEAAVDTLPEPQRLALVLFAMEQMPQKEVAAIMECSVEMVKWNVFQARKNLKARLADYLEET